MGRGETTVTRRSLGRPGVALAILLFTLLLVAVAGARMSHGTGATAAVRQGGDEAPAALGNHLAAKTAFAPPGSSDYLEGGQSSADEEFLIRSAPGTTLPAPVLQHSANDWTRASGRGAEGQGHWDALGPTWGKNLPNPYRDRSVYTAATQDFSGRIAHVAIDPKCGKDHHPDDEGDGEQGGDCRL